MTATTYGSQLDNSHKPAGVPEARRPQAAISESTYRDASYEETLARMKQKLARVVPEAEIVLAAELVVEIEALKKQHNAIILGHNYMEPALYHTVPDFRGDSLELARRSAETDADVIVFCGVEFMAETAKILNPGKKVLIPSLRAGCSLASSITAADVRELKRRYPGVPVVTYVNSYADVKAETDICCTSGNARAVVESLASEDIIFIPDEYLARNIARETGKRLIVPTLDPRQVDPLPSQSADAGEGVERVLIGWQGKCEVHEKFSVDDITQVRRQFPQVVVLAHPECPPEVCAAADFSGSTSAMIKYVRERPAPHYLLLTECSMADNIMAENPERELLRLCSVRCPHMAQITLEMTRDALRHLRYEVDVPEDIRLKAKRSLDRMLAIG